MPYAVLGQELKLGVSKNPVAVGEQFTIEFSFDGDASNFIGPNLTGLRKLGGPNKSSSSSMQIINGKVTSSNTTSFSYYVKALNEGQITIGEASVKSNGKTYRSKAGTIEIVKSNPKSKQESLSITDNVTLNASVNRSSVFQGEQIVVTYKLVSKINLADINLTAVPEFNGFWKDEIESNSNGKIEVINGQRHRVWEVKRYILTPQKSGTLKIDPMKIDVTVQIQNRRSNDPFRDPFGFFGSTQNVVEEVSSRPIAITVEDLPSKAPENFSGAVGQFKIASSVDKLSLDANQAVNYTIVLSGKGNLHLIDNVPVSFPSNFETYDPQKKDKVFTSKSGYGGKVEFEHLLVPRFKGEYIIEKHDFCYFDPKAKDYKTISTEPITINVLKGKEDSEAYFSSEKLSESSSQKLRNIYNQTKLFSKTEKKNHDTLVFLLLLLPIIGIIVYLIALYIQARNMADPILGKYKKSLKIAQKRLIIAKKHQKNDQKELFFEEIEKSLWSYFSNKFNVNTADLSKDTINDFFKKNSISESVSNNFTSIIEKSEFCRFAPSSLDAEDMNRVYELATKVIIDVEQDLKK